MKEAFDRCYYYITFVVSTTEMSKCLENSQKEGSFCKIKMGS